MICPYAPETSIASESVPSATGPQYRALDSSLNEQGGSSCLSDSVLRELTTAKRMASTLIVPRTRSPPAGVVAPLKGEVPEGLLEKPHYARTVLKAWSLEIAAIVLAVASLVGVVATTMVYADKPLP